MKTIYASLMLTGLICLGGCVNNPPVAVTSTTTATNSTAAQVTATPAPQAGGLHGVVAERLEVASYTYLRITGPSGDTWAAVPTTQVPVGATVTITNPMPMQKFQSKTLKRTFDVIMFGSSAEVDGAAPATPAPGMTPAPAMTPAPGETPAKDPHAGMGTPAPAAELENIKVSKAPGSDGYTVSEVYGKSAELKDKTISVHAKVVKVTSGVLGRNWLHLRDGSGGDKDNDLVVTTTDNVAVNDEVTVKGAVHTNKDLGSGYSYKVLIEDAKVSK